MLREGMAARMYEFQTSLSGLQKDLEWMDACFDPREATEEERTLAKYLEIIENSSVSRAVNLLQMLHAEVRVSGYLSKLPSGRYGIEGTDVELTSGSTCEVYAPYHELGDDEELLTWQPMRVEYDCAEYHFIENPYIRLDGVLIRIKRMW